MAQPPPGYVLVPAAPVRPPTSGLAVAGFVFSLLFGCGALSVIGLGLSIAGLYVTRDGRYSGRGLATAGVTLGALGTVFGVVWVITAING